MVKETTGLTDRQREIIEAAISLIAEKGIQELTIKNISRKIGLSEGAIYRHFESKLDILKGILDTFKASKENLLEVLNEENLTPDIKLKKLLFERFEYFENHPAIASVIFSEEIFRNDAQLSEYIYEIMFFMQDVFVKIIQDGQRRGVFKKNVSPKSLGYMITGAMRNMVLRWKHSGFSYSLKEEGIELWQTVEILIKEDL